MVVAALPASLLPFLKVGGGYNNLSWDPRHGARMRLEHRARLARARRFPRDPSSARRSSAAFAALLVSGVYPPERALPTPAGRASAAALDYLLGSLQGGVLVPTHPFLGQRHHDEPRQVLIWGYFEVWLSGRPGMSADLAARDIRTLDPRWLAISESDPLVANDVKASLRAALPHRAPLLPRRLSFDRAPPVLRKSAPGKTTRGARAARRSRLLSPAELTCARESQSSSLR